MATLNATAPSFQLGNDASNRQFRSVLSFDTGSLPDNAVITQVTLRIKKAGPVGAVNPFAALGNILVDIKKGSFGLPGLQLTDFQALPTRSGVISIRNNPLTGGWYYGILGGLSNTLLSKTGPTQFRLQFTKDDNNNHTASGLKFYSGNAAVPADRPALIITYYIP